MRMVLSAGRGEMVGVATRRRVDVAATSRFTAKGDGQGDEVACARLRTKTRPGDLEAWPVLARGPLAWGPERLLIPVIVDVMTELARPVPDQGIRGLRLDFRARRDQLERKEGA